VWWLTSIIPATWEVEIGSRSARQKVSETQSHQISQVKGGIDRRSKVQSQPWDKKSETLSEKK
jgi:hypothetical protein